jgi:hypothetical protein
MSKTSVEKALKDVAKTIKTLTIAKAPQSKNGSNGNRPGNLKRKINTANTYSTMIKYNVPKAGYDAIAARPATVTIDYAPPGAGYGEFWDEPATDKSRTKHRPEFGFPTKARDNINVDAAIALYIVELENDLVERLEKEIAKL